MSVFDTLAENRCQQWLEDKATPGYCPPASVSNSASRTSFEAQLYRQAHTLLDRTATLPKSNSADNSVTRQALLAQVDALHIQLTVLLEKKNLPLVVAALTRSLNQRRAELGMYSG